MYWRIFSRLLLFLLIACGPRQVIYMKEKVKETERNAAPRFGINNDRFQVGVATGPVDILFVVDNTETADQIQATFEASYTSFTLKLADKPARLLDYRVALVTSPTDRVIKNYFSPSGNAKSNYSEIFIGIDNLPPMLTARENGFPIPLEATAAALGSKALTGRSNVPIFIVYLLGADSPPNIGTGSFPSDVHTLVQMRGSHQSHLVTITRTSQIIPDKSFPYCNTFMVASQSLATLMSGTWRSTKQYDLCDPHWGGFHRDLMQAVLNFKKRMVLKSIPYQPETMVVRGATRLYRFEDDYRYDPLTNEIVFIKEGVIQDGDLVDVAYYEKPGEPVLDAPVPTALPDPNPTATPTLRYKK